MCAFDVTALRAAAGDSVARLTASPPGLVPVARQRASRTVPVAFMARIGSIYCQRSGNCRNSCQFCLKTRETRSLFSQTDLCKMNKR